MSPPRSYKITLTIGPISFHGPGNKLQQAQRFARDLRSVVARALACGRRSKVIDCKLEEVDMPGGEER